MYVVLYHRLLSACYSLCLRSAHRTAGSAFALPQLLLATPAYKPTVERRQNNVTRLLFQRRKHVKHALCENSQQTFWPGVRHGGRLFGYRCVVAADTGYANSQFAHQVTSALYTNRSPGLPSSLAWLYSIPPCRFDGCLVSRVGNRGQQFRNVLRLPRSRSTGYLELSEEVGKIPCTLTPSNSGWQCVSPFELSLVCRPLVYAFFTKIILLITCPYHTFRCIDFIPCVEFFPHHMFRCIVPMY